MLKYAAKVADVERDKDEARRRGGQKGRPGFGNHAGRPRALRELAAAEVRSRRESRNASWNRSGVELTSGRRRSELS